MRSYCQQQTQWQQLYSHGLLNSFKIYWCLTLSKSIHTNSSILLTLLKALDIAASQRDANAMNDRLISWCFSSVLVRRLKKQYHIVFTQVDKIQLHIFSGMNLSSTQFVLFFNTLYWKQLLLSCHIRHKCFYCTHKDAQYQINWSFNRLHGRCSTFPCHQHWFYYWNGGKSEINMLSTICYNKDNSWVFNTCTPNTLNGRMLRSEKLSK